LDNPGYYNPTEGVSVHRPELVSVDEAQVLKQGEESLPTTQILYIAEPSQQSLGEGSFCAILKIVSEPKIAMKKNELKLP